MNIWPAEAVCAVMMLLGIYAMTAPDVERLPLPGRRRAFLERRFTPIFQAHVNDIRDFAGWASNQLHGTMRGGQRYAITQQIDLSTPMGSHFRSHFPEAAALVDEWNEAAEGYEDASRGFTKATYDAETSVLRGATNGHVGFAGLLQSYATDQVQLSDITWQVQAGQLNAVMPSGAFWQIGKVPESVAETDRLLVDSWGVLENIKNQSDIARWNAKRARVAELRKPVLDALEAAHATHDPEGRCTGCPKQ